MTTSAVLTASTFDVETDAALPIPLQIELFLNGVTDGGPLFDMLYGSVADEPIPERLLAVVHGPC